MLATIQPGQAVILEDKMFDLFFDEIPGIELAAVNTFPYGGQETVGPVPGVQGVIIPASENPMPFSFPRQVNVVTVRHSLALPAAQGFSLEFAPANRTFLHGADVPFHAKLAITVYCMVQVLKHLWGFSSRLAPFFICQVRTQIVNCHLISACWLNVSGYSRFPN